MVAKLLKEVQDNGVRSVDRIRCVFDVQWLLLRKLELVSSSLEQKSLRTMMSPAAPPALQAATYRHLDFPEALTTSALK